MDLQRHYKIEKLNEAIKGKTMRESSDGLGQKLQEDKILQDIIPMLEKYEDEAEVLERLQEDYNLSNEEAYAYLQEAEELFLQQFEDEGDE